MTGRQRHKWQYLISEIEKFAKKENCLNMELIARPGWKKVLNKFGYKPPHIMSFLGGGSSGGGQTQTTTQQPYAPAQPALNQIISEAGQIYGQGPAAAGYVAPTTQTTQGIAQQEVMANAAQQQLADTLSGKYLNPFLL